ncbi:asialoglycoprotein receptor 2-like [Triplophysa rosa]|uniref:asialoglycoprotein receptor 2-like n=1 Tax=Triplophysa rosa TaxID=992332 RepID=UPI002545D1F0|nr:asialoglycoprotein receptor 2-like [Triplophysa rosa]
MDAFQQRTSNKYCTSQTEGGGNTLNLNFNHKHIYRRRSSVVVVRVCSDGFSAAREEVTGKMKMKITSYYVSQCSKPSNERRESGVEREMRDDSDETELDIEGERSPVALHGSEHTDDQPANSDSDSDGGVDHPECALQSGCQEGMQVNLIDGPDLDFQDCRNNAEVRYSVLQTPRCDGKRPFCQEPFKVATACLVAFCLLLLVVLVATNVHNKSSSSRSADAHMLKTCANVTELTSELQALRKEKSELEKERSQLKAIIAELEASASTPVQVTTQSTPGRVTASDSCPSDWHYFSGSCYFISDDINSWSYSQAFCKQRGGHLAIIHTPEEQTFIWDLLPRGHWKAYWIGISDEKVEDDWYWVDGTKLVGGFWEDGEPNNHMNEDC